MSLLLLQALVYPFGFTFGVYYYYYYQLAFYNSAATWVKSLGFERKGVLANIPFWHLAWFLTGIKRSFS
jgi:hypothetical protein